MVFAHLKTELDNFIITQCVYCPQDADSPGEKDSVENEEQKMIYNVSESPPIYLSIFFGLQVGTHIVLSHLICEM